MKTMFKSFFAAALMIASLGVAQAAETSKTYTAQNGVVFSLEKVRKVALKPIPTEGNSGH